MDIEAILDVEALLQAYSVEERSTKLGTKSGGLWGSGYSTSVALLDYSPKERLFDS
ncbi:uncharacterized protein TrAFT101_004404 [Trichoderma asperellum]|uniref:uncharacterized protein n=1 Tax=Trichoderma asperellum TaxID=101201 RepID=UPI00332D914B|nr:hypothetical protein TrAFT101_004404 [Trichoderma asperellum]